ncbi:hypothetical protein MC885_010896, partial [Smutsia gigantea]
SWLHLGTTTCPRLTPKKPRLLPAVRAAPAIGARTSQLLILLLQPAQLLLPRLQIAGHLQGVLLKVPHMGGRHPLPLQLLLRHAAAARGGQLLLLQGAAVVQRETEDLVLQLQCLVEVGAGLALHAAVVGLQLAQALGAGLGLTQALFQLPALLQQCLLLPLLLAQLLLRAADSPRQALRQLGRLREPCGGEAVGPGTAAMLLSP